MNKYIKKENLPKIILVLAVIIFTVIILNKQDTKEVKNKFFGNDISSAIQITCTYPQILNVSYVNNEVSHNLPKAETNPLIFTFSEFKDSDVANLSYIDSTQTITNVPLVKLIEDEGKIIFIDGSGKNYFSTHRIDKKLAISTYTKTVDILGIPSGSLAMGTCVGY